MAENPYEASEVAAEERRPVPPFDVTWFRLSLSVLLASVPVTKSPSPLTLHRCDQV